LTELITTSKSLEVNGTILAQLVPFEGYHTIHKASVHVTVVSRPRQSMIIGSDGILSFLAANFMEGRDTWAFQPVLHWSVGPWSTSGTSISNSLQTAFYGDATDASSNASYLTYDLFFDNPGIYYLWGYGYTSIEGIFWCLDNDVSDMRRAILGSPSGPPEWTNFGTIYIEEGGLHTFSVFLSEASTVVLDQWYFTQDDGFAGGFSPVSALSKAPFSLACRIRSLNNNALDSLVSPIAGGSSITSWVGNKMILDSSKYNFAIQDSETTGMTFLEGISLELWQIGGSSEMFAAWNYIFPESSIGTAYYSNDHGQNFSAL
jgi:hypothetical protein